MINLDFQTSKVNLLFNCMWVAQNDKQMQILLSKIDLEHILEPDELDLLQQIFKRHDFNGYSLPFALNNWAGLINDENYAKQIENLLKGELKRFEFAKEINDKLPTFLSLIQKLTNTKEFEKLYTYTTEYKDILEKRWKVKQEEISGFIENIIGKESKDTATAMIEAPISNNGAGFSETRHLLFSRRHDRDKENPKMTALLELVYLAHESMHTHVLPYKEGQSEQSRKNLHGFIQYLVDNELCYRLFKEQGIPYEYGNNKQHDLDEKTFANMYPFFIGYLYRNEENVVSLIEENMKRNRLFSSKKDSKGEYHTIYSAEAIARYFKDKKDMTPYEFSNIDFNKKVGHFLEQDISHTF